MLKFFAEMMVQVAFLKRLTAGLAIAGPIAFHFAAAPISEVGRRSEFLAPTPALTAHLNVVPVGLRWNAPGRFQDSTLVKQAFAAQTSELIWSAALPLAERGDGTIENVRLAAEAIDLAAVQPKQTFSFNDIVGIRCEKKGYRPGLMYSNGEVVTGIGGGICIVSTLLYNAALETGLKIIERHPHSGPVSYAGPGRDAAVSFGYADLRFKNNTGSMLLVRSTVQQDKLVVALYGTEKPGRTVEIIAEDYEEIPWEDVEKEDITVPVGEVVLEQKARPGHTVTIVRLIKQDGELVSREVISRDVILPRPVIVRMPLKPELLPLEIRQARKPLELPSVPKKAGTGPIPTLTKPWEPKSQSEALPLPGASDRSLSVSERTVPTASE